MNKIKCLAEVLVERESAQKLQVIVRRCLTGVSFISFPSFLFNSAHLNSLDSLRLALIQPLLRMLSWSSFKIFLKFKYLKVTLNIVTNCVCAYSVCLSLCNPMDCSLPGSSVHGIFQARILEWVAIS